MSSLGLSLLFERDLAFAQRIFAQRTLASDAGLRHERACAAGQHDLGNDIGILALGNALVDRLALPLGGLGVLPRARHVIASGHATTPPPLPERACMVRAGST